MGMDATPEIQNLGKINRCCRLFAGQRFFAFRSSFAGLFEEKLSDGLDPLASGHAVNRPVLQN
jgi:hypothetical protein